MSYREVNGHLWRKSGDRCFRMDPPSGLFNAIVFGASAQQQMWAWGVWSSKRSDEGIEFSLVRAMTKANAVIGELERTATERPAQRGGI